MKSEDCNISVSGSLRLLIHHHHLVFSDREGVYWLSSVIGRWSIELAKYFQVELLLYESAQRISVQDTEIDPQALRITSLGIRQRFWKRIRASGRQRKICAQAGQRADLLLIRGITPHQFMVWRNTPAPQKAFLLVGSLMHHKMGCPRSIADHIVRILSKRRLTELRTMANNRTLLLANSPALVSEIEQHLGQKAQFVPTNSIRQSEFADFRIRSVSSPWKLLYCGRLDFKKGLHELFLAVERLHQEGYNCRLDLVGEKNVPAYDELRCLARRLGIEGFVNWSGMVQYGSELFKKYQEADAFVLPSYSEGFPHAIWEAAANCCPVIATSVGGIPSLITDNHHALLVPPRDAGSLTNAIKCLFETPLLREKLITHAYDYAQGFTLEACAERLAEVLYMQAR